jgi:DNA-binding GntR family transcriptional regulator
MFDPEGDTHLYLQISEILRARVLKAAEGDPVPSEAAIQQEFGVARTTARRAIHVLRDEGLIYTVQGEGTFVGAPGEAPRKPRRAPLYRQIAGDIVERIESGRYAPRRAIPAESALLKKYGCARETVRRAMALLREQGWIYTVPQRGSYVSPKDSWPGR